MGMKNASFYAANTQSISSCDAASAKVSSFASKLVCEQRIKLTTKSQLERRRVYCYKQSAFKKYRYLYQFLGFILCYFMAPEILAGVFDVIPTDKSKQYLGMIFGGSVGTISLGGSANPMLSKMFEKFNFIVVTAGVVVLS